MLGTSSLPRPGEIHGQCFGICQTDMEKALVHGPAILKNVSNPIVDSWPAVHHSLQMKVCLCTKDLPSSFSKSPNNCPFKFLLLYLSLHQSSDLNSKANTATTPDHRSTLSTACWRFAAVAGVCRPSSLVVPKNAPRSFLLSCATYGHHTGEEFLSWLCQEN